MNRLLSSAEGVGILWNGSGVGEKLRQNRQLSRLTQLAKTFEEESGTGGLVVILRKSQKALIQPVPCKALGEGG